jgi:hypothetical protein
MTWSRLVFLDGIWVPTASVFCEWSDKGTAGCRITLVPSQEAKEILPSTHVHVFHVESGLAAKKKAVVSLPTDASLADRSMFAAESARTVGETFFPSWDPGVDGFWFNGLPLHAMHLRFAGEVVSVAEAESAGQGASTQLVCRGYDHLMDIIQAIQLTRGRGTLAEEERRFFGQQNPVFVGTGRRAFFDGMAGILENSEYGLAETCRRLASVYPARLNTWAAHRFAWTRLADQICSVDNDSTVERLLSTRAFSRFLRDAIQQKYSVTLRAAISEILRFPSYRLISVPTPAYFPLHRPNTPVEETSAEETDQEVSVPYRYAEVTIPESPPVPVIPPGLTGTLIGSTGETGNTIWVLREEDGTETALETQVLPGGTVVGRITNANRTLTIRVPDGMNGGGQTFTVTLPEATVHLLIATPLTEEALSEFQNGATYMLDLSSMYAEPTYASADADSDFVCTAQVRTRARTVRRQTEQQSTVTPAVPEEPEELNANWARLGAYAIVPHLWWAAPPACNVVIPDEILGWQVADPGVDNITRLMAKIAPGRSGSSKVLIDQFSAPNTYDLNQGLRDPDNEPRDPTEGLYRTEYISGPRIDVYYFEKLHRMVEDNDWEGYLSSFISTEFWNRRLGAKVAMLSMRNSIRPVVGAPMLVIRGSGSEQTQAANPEQLHWLARLRNLEALRRRLSNARARLGGNVSVARRVRTILQNRYLLRAVLERLPSNYSSENVSAQESMEGGWVGAVAPQGSEAGRFSIPQIATSLSRDAIRFVPLAPLDGGGELSGTPFSGSQEQIRQLITTDQDDAIAALTEMYLSPSQWTLGKITRWYEEVGSNTRDPSACRGAVGEDIDLVEDAIEACREALRGLSVDTTEDPSYLGYVSSVAESSSPQGNTLTVQLTHVRKVGADLDWDGLNTDDPESVVAFGADGYMDEQYRSDKIGENVYKPIFGCGSIVDLDLARANQDLEDEEVAQVDGLPPIDASDIRAQLSHSQVCGRDYTDPETAEIGAASASTTSSAARALISEYRIKKTTGARSEELFEWLEGIRVRATASPADMYRNMPVRMTRNGAQVEPVDVSRDDDAAYTGDQRLNGFFRSSFLAGDMDYDRVRVLSLQSTGATEEVTLTEDEKDLLKERVRRVETYLRSVSDKTFSRTG